MEWRDEGTVLTLRAHGERATLVEVFTQGHGRHAGILRGGRKQSLLQPGSLVSVTWRARLPEHLGTFSLDPQRGRAAALMQDARGLAGLAAICALAHAALPEREPFPALQSRTETLLDLLAMTDAWPLAYLQWELSLLGDLGFALALERCAVTGTEDDLAFVSPRTGRAVSRAAAGKWADRLLPLPAVLRGQGEGTEREICAALDVTGFFLERALDIKPGALPAARARLLRILERHSAGENTS